MIKGIFLCADDYSQDKAISEGICSLAEKKRLNAISCLVNTPLWPTAHENLKPLQATCFIGLHLNLTFGRPLSLAWQNHYGQSFNGLASILKQSLLRQLNKNSLIAEIQTQLETFKQVMGVYPDFIDGHQHIHQLPIIREALISLYQQLGLTSFFRNTSNGYGDLWALNNLPKRPLIALLGGIGFKNELNKKQILANSSFAGIYNFNKANHYRHYFKQFLNEIQHEGLIMCHPGLPSQEKEDQLHASRSQELEYFLSDMFIEDLNAYNCKLIEKQHGFLGHVHV